MKDKKIKQILNELENLDLTLLSYLIQVINNKDNLSNLELEELENIHNAVKQININKADIFFNTNNLLENLELIDNILKKEKVITFRISFLDYLKLKNKAEEQQISISSFIRKCLNNCI